MSFLEDNNLEIHLLQESKDPKRDLLVQRQALASKIKSLKGQLDNLLQKKIRLDLEIKRTHAKLSKLKEKGSFNLKSSIRLEGVELTDSSEPSRTFQILTEKADNQTVQELLMFDHLLDEVEETEMILKRCIFSEEVVGIIPEPTFKKIQEFPEN